MIDNNIEKITAIKPDIDDYYKEINNINLPVKIYKSYNTDICIVSIHGGSWTAIKNPVKNWNGSWMNFQAQYYKNKNFTTAAFSYRSIDLTEKTNIFDLIKDCKDAIKYIKDKTDFKKLILIGDSAGAHLCLELAYDEEIRPDIVIAANPVLNLNTEKWSFTAANEEDRIKASPFYNIEKLNTKFLFMHGNADNVVDCSITKEYSEKMQQAGNICKYIELDGAEHAFILYGYKSSDADVIKYMKMIDEFINAEI